jgi:hypothetical protein
LKGAAFTQAEQTFRRDGEGACRIRLDRLRFQTDDYFTRLTTAKTLLVFRMEDRERQKHERAQAMNEAAFGHYLDRAEGEVHAAPAVDDWRLHSIAPWLRRS